MIEDLNTTPSKPLQRAIRVAIQGYEGSFHHMAARQVFPEEELALLAADTFRSLVELVVEGSAECGLMAIENSLAGSIAPNYSLLLESGLLATEEVYLPIHQHLMALPGTSIDEIREVHSHPMALAQCGRFLRSHPHWQLVETADTALSARCIAEGGLRHVAAIGPELAAKCYGLEILHHHIEDNPANFTRFLVIRRRGGIVLPAFAHKVSVCFTLPHEVGSLNRLLGVLAESGANLTKIQSMPIVGKPWEYIFFVDFVLPANLPWQSCLQTMAPLTGSLKLLGIFNHPTVKGEKAAEPADRVQEPKPRPASRLDHVGEYYFSTKLAAIASMEQNGRRIINLGIGSPDLAPPPAAVEALAKAVRGPRAHRYPPYRGSAELRQAFADWYAQHFGVYLDPHAELLPLIGSKEGLFHVAMSFLERGDEALVPNPGYPSYRAVTLLAGAHVREYPLSEDDGWLPDLDALELQDLSRVKLMWVNYPHMPTGAVASAECLERIVAFARRHGILLVNDNPYAFILNPTPLSILSANGAQGVALELNSLSKSHNLAGWRVGVLCGAAHLIDTVVRFKSNVDSGHCIAIHEAAAQALREGPAWYERLDAAYTRRKRLAVALLKTLGCKPWEDGAGMFVWARIPAGWADAFEFTDALLLKAGVFITPGGIFGTQGLQWVRMSLCSPEEDFRQAHTLLAEAGFCKTQNLLVV